MCYYFDDTIKFQDFDLDNTLIDEKSDEKILVYNISYKNLIGNKLLHNRFDNTDGFIRIYDGITIIVMTSTLICLTNLAILRPFRQF